jgi:hypothetical protein
VAGLTALGKDTTLKTLRTLLPLPTACKVIVDEQCEDIVHLSGVVSGGSRQHRKAEEPARPGARHGTGWRGAGGRHLPYAGQVGQVKRQAGGELRPGSRGSI